MQNKIKNKLKTKMVNPTMIILVIMILVLICSFVLFFEVNDYRKYKEEKHDFYYYFSKTRVDFKGIITLNSKDTIISLTNDNVTINSSPVYYAKDNGKVILPANMEIIYPYKLNPMYKLGKFSKIYYKGNYLYINSEAGEGRIYDSFLYDGKDLYMFLENTTLFVDGQQYNLNPLSFVEATNGYIRIYNYSNNEYSFIQDFDFSTVKAYTDEYFINLYDDSFTYKDRYYLLIKSIDGLDFYSFN